MTTLKRFSLALSFTLFVFTLAARGQTPTVSTVNVTPEAGRVRVAAAGEVYDVRLEVVDEEGKTVFQGAQAGSRPLDWDLRDATGARVAPGTYTVEVSYGTRDGKPRKRIEQVLVTAQSGADQQPALSTQGQTPANVGTITGEGASGKIAKFTGANTIASSVITETSGRIGIGTASPGSKLTVIGGGVSVIGALNNVASSTPGVGVTGTGGPGAATSTGTRGGTGVAGQGGKGGDATQNNTTSFGIGGTGVYGTGGEGGNSGAGPTFGGIGVYGVGGPNYGPGVVGESEAGDGVRGSSDTGSGVVGESHDGKAVAGYTNGGPGFAAFFDGKVQINGSTSLIGSSTLSFGATTRQMLNLYNTSYGIGVQIGTEYFRTNGGFAWFKGGAHSNTQNSPGPGGTLLMRLDASGNLFTTGAINPPSDRAAKANFAAVNPRAILDKLAAIPVQTWNYKGEEGKVRHIGPVAQDFSAAFNLGADDKHISTVDADGVAMAAIQGLYQQNQELTNEVRQLRTQLLRQQAQLNQLRRRRAARR